MEDAEPGRPFWQAHYYDFNVFAHAKFVEKLRYIHRNSLRRGLVAKPEDWQWSSYRHYQTGIRGQVEIESEGTASHRGLQLPEWMRYWQFGSAFPVPKSEGPGAPTTVRESLLEDQIAVSIFSILDATIARV